jgi:hypothetical protein
VVGCVVEQTSGGKRGGFCTYSGFGKETIFCNLVMI